MKPEVMRIFLAVLGFALYLGLPGAGSLPRAEAAISSLDQTLPPVAADEEPGSDESGGEDEEPEDDSD